MALTEAEEIELLQLLELEEQDRLFQPQPGPQKQFLESRADIALYGGAAGGGKTYALLLENLRHIDNPKFGSVIFRRESPQITVEGGLWDNASALYPLRGGKPKQGPPRHEFKFPSGAKVSFAHLQHEHDVHNWQGAQIPLIAFDELTHFTRKQFFYMLSRSRSTCGVKPYIRATTNPDADSWVASFIQWWWDPNTGYAIPERSGKVRWFVRLGDEVAWGDSPEELAARHGTPVEDAKSFTFIRSSVYDNKILLEKDPAYLTNLKALDPVERARLLDGNWKIKPAAGLYFPRDKACIVDAVPGKIVAICRAWDLAATERSPQNPSPDATSGVKFARLEDGRYIVLNVKHGCWNSDDVDVLMRSTAHADRDDFAAVRIRAPQDPGQAGKVQAKAIARNLAGFDVKILPVSGDKVLRARPLSAQWHAGNVLILRGDWNDAYLTEMDGFPDLVHDDDVDASSDAFAEVALVSEPIADVEATTYDEILNAGYDAGYAETWGF